MEVSELESTANPEIQDISELTGKKRSHFRLIIIFLLVCDPF